jgi:hypothetical protein
MAFPQWQKTYTGVEKLSNSYAEEGIGDGRGDVGLEVIHF